MLTLGLPHGPLSLLCLGAHADDLEIGCGGTLLQLLDRHPGSTVTWVVMSGPGEREHEARQSASRLLAGAGGHRVTVHGFRDGYFPAAYAELKDTLEQLKEVAPDLVFTHFPEDRHQDHRLLSELTWQTFRGHLVLEYEVPKYDGDLGRPNAYVPLTDEIRRQKIEHLLTAFPSQREKRWFSEETFKGLMRLRGIECAAPDGYAEAFYLHKATITP